jgi:hypothetical protein
VVPTRHPTKFCDQQGVSFSLMSRPHTQAVYRYWQAKRGDRLIFSNALWIAPASQLAKLSVHLAAILEDKDVRLALRVSDDGVFPGGAGGRPEDDVTDRVSMRRADLYQSIFVAEVSDCHAGRLLDFR